MNKKQIITFLSIVFVLIAGFVIWKFIFSVPSDQEDPKYLADMTLANQYKSDGAQGDKEAYQKAIDLYKSIIIYTDGKIWLPYLNMGNVYKALGDYKSADQAYDDGIKIAGDSMLWIAKIELYQDYIKKPFTEVKKVYDESLKSTIENTTIYINYASYLDDNKEYEDALAIYKVLYERYPNNQGYKEKIEELGSRL